MRKIRQCAIALLWLMLVSLVTPVKVLAESVDSHLLPVAQLSTNEMVPATENKVSVNDAVVPASPGLSDEAWLLLSAMLAFASVIIIHKLA